MSISVWTLLTVTFSRPDHLCRLATAGKGLFLAVGDLAEASY